jgi:hypothetical protein
MIAAIAFRPAANLPRTVRGEGWSGRMTPVFVAVAAALLYLQLFQPAGAPIFLVTADQAIKLGGAARMISGEAIYRNFFRFTFPGTETL